MKKYNALKDEVLLVGDSKYDCIAAKKASVPFVFLTYGYGNKKEVLKEKPDYCFKEFTRIKNIIFKCEE